MYHSNSLFCYFLFCIFSTIIHASIAAPTKPTELVDNVCSQTTNYTFCVDSLYSDWRTPDADRIVLAYISFDLAYKSASYTKNLIAELLKKPPSNGLSEYNDLQICRADYEKAYQTIILAGNDLDSESYYDLGDDADTVYHAADHCRMTLLGSPPVGSPLAPPPAPAASGGSSLVQPVASMSVELKGLGEICAAVAKLFTTHEF